METPEWHEESADEEYNTERVLCTTETVVVDNEEPLNVPSEVSRDVSPNQPSNLEFYKTILEEGKFFPSLAFTLSTDTKSHQPVVVVSQRELAYHPPFGLVSRVVITIQGCKYTVHILMRMWESGE